MIEITKACTVAFMKARNSLVAWCREKRVNWKKTEDGENLYFKVLVNKFWLLPKTVHDSTKLFLADLLSNGRKCNDMLLKVD